MYFNSCTCIYSYRCKRVSMSAKEIIKAFDKAYTDALKIEIELHRIKLRERGVYVFE